MIFSNIDMLHMDGVAMVENVCSVSNDITIHSKLFMSRQCCSCTCVAPDGAQPGAVSGMNKTEK